MGNHEWCPNCEESDFHYGSDCDPNKVATRIAREKKQEAKKRMAVSYMKAALDKAGIKFELDEYKNAIVRWGNYL